MVIAVGLLVVAPAVASNPVLFGKVTKGPTTPICVEGEPCEAPAANVTLVFVRGGEVKARATTRADGSYRVRLAPGGYSARVSPPPRIGTGLTPRQVRVADGHSSRINFHLDTGLQ